MRVVLFALTGFGNTALEALQETGCDVAAVVTEKEPGPFPHYPEENLSEVARRQGIPVYENLDLKGPQGYEVVRGLAPDLALIATFRQIVPARLVSVPKRGTINVHPSLLPKYRGATPTNWVLVFGESETGVSLHWAISRPDAGDMISQRRVPIALDETDGTLRRKLAAAAKGMIVEVIEKLKLGQVPAGHSQDANKATLFPKRAKRDALIKFDEPTLNVHNRIRGMSPYPGAYTLHHGSEVRIIASEPVRGESFELTPGLITRRVDGSLVVKTKDGLIQVKTDPDIVDEEIQRSPIVFGEEAAASMVAPGASYKSAITHTREVYGIETGAEEFPKMVVLSVAYPCNAKCPHCPYTESNSDIRKKYADAPFIAPGLFRKIADECATFGAFLRITGGGEPMLHPADMASLIEYAKSVGAKVWMNTNGSLVTPDKADRLLACGIDLIEFSVDAADPDTYKIVRAGLDWDRLVSNVSYITGRRNQTRSPTRIVASAVNQEIVRGKLDQIADFWLAKGVDEVIRRKFLTWGSNTTLDPGRSADPTFYLDKMRGDPCPFPFHRLNIDSRGKIEVCGYDIMGRTNFGTVKEQTIKEIWKGPMFEWWRGMHAQRRGGEIPLCRECPDWQYRSWNHNWEKVLKNAETHRKNVVDIFETEEVQVANKLIKGGN